MPAPDSAAVTIKVPFAVRKRGGRKLVLAPDGAPVPLLAPQVDSTLVKAIARAFRWQKMLETGRYATIKEIARAEKINPSYVSRVLRLTLLAPATVEAILDGRADAAPTLAEAMKVFPVEWKLQCGAHWSKMTAIRRQLCWTNGRNWEHFSSASQSAYPELLFPGTPEVRL
jgi:hypothetical protein